MRDEERITRIMEELTTIWKRNPDMRFNQLLINLCVIPDGRHWFIPDKDVEQVIKDSVNEL